MTTATIGAAKITRIEESYAPSSRRAPSSPTGATRSWPNICTGWCRTISIRDRMPQAQRPLLADRDRRQEDPDRHLRRQSQASQVSAVLGRPQHALSRAPCGGRREAGRHRHGDVHAPACRPCRLEHAARQRPLGADVSERPLRVQQDRLRPFSALDRDPKTGPASHGSFRDSVLPVVEAGLAQMVDGAQPIEEHLAIEPTPGHTPGHVVIKLASQGAGLLLGRCDPPRDAGLSPGVEQLRLRSMPRRAAVTAQAARRLRRLRRAVGAAAFRRAAHLPHRRQGRRFHAAVRVTAASEIAASHIAGRYAPARRRTAASGRVRRRSSRSDWPRRTACRRVACR